MGDILVKILSMFGGWGWITMGAIIIAGGAIMLLVYLREPRDRQALLYSLRNYAFLAGIGLLCVVLGIVELRRDQPAPLGPQFKALLKDKGSNK